MLESLAFDLYDERWRDFWIAATSVTRLRKKQIDVDIRLRVARLLQDHGPQSEKPLTLRIYGTMLKGFCVVNNERARMLFVDSERVALMFARQPFAEGDNRIRLPAAKKPRMEAALTLDLDLARVEASEAFDWTQAPLEEGALLRLGGGLLSEADGLPPSIELTGQMDGLANQVPPQMVDPSIAADSVALGGMLGTDAGWLPRLDGTYEELAMPGAGAVFLSAEQQQQPMDPLMSQIVAMEAEGAAAMDALRTADAPWLPPATEAEVGQQSRKRRGCRDVSSLIRPGMVYGFDSEPKLPSKEYDSWQQDSSSFTLTRMRASEYAHHLADSRSHVDHLGPRLRLLIDPPNSTFLKVPAPSWARAGDLPDVQGLLRGEARGMAAEFEHFHEAMVEEAGLRGGDVSMLDAFDSVMPPEVAEPAELSAAAVSEGAAGGAESQDDRTAEVAAIIRSCLRNSGMRETCFHELVPHCVDKATAACTFASLLALASAGELLVMQAEPYGDIIISDSC